LAQLFWRMAKSLATNPDPPPALATRWSTRKNSRRAYKAMCEIPFDIPKDELDRRLRVFGGNHFGISPTITLHGIEFRAGPRPSQKNEGKLKDQGELRLAGSQGSLSLWPFRGGGTWNGISFSTVVSKGAPAGGVTSKVARTWFWKIGAPGSSSE
jgi:hypothetical protein